MTNSFCSKNLPTKINKLIFKVIVQIVLYNLNIHCQTFSFIYNSCFYLKVVYTAVHNTNRNKLNTHVRKLIKLLMSNFKFKCQNK